MKKALIAVLIASMLLIPLAFYSCTSPEGFAIYLTRDDTPVSEMPALSHVDIADEPIISADDIISYSKNTHEIELTAEAYQRVTELKVPTSGTAFLVCVDKAPIYWGAFWMGFSSQSFDGVTIMVLPPSQKENVIQLELGYPSLSFYQGEDPRSNPEILKSLEEAGKLK